jgi:hypothetical protein
VNSNDGAKFRQALGTLRDCYPGYRPDNDAWGKVLAAYWQKLEVVPWDAVSRACITASNPEYYPDYFPSAGQLRRVADECEQRISAQRKREQDEMSRVSAQQSDEDALRDFVRRVPSAPDAQRSYVAEANGPWETLARIWECDSRTRCLHPNECTPHDVQAIRMRQFWGVWDLNAGEHEVVS